MFVYCSIQFEINESRIMKTQVIVTVLFIFSFGLASTAYSQSAARQGELQATTVLSEAQKEIIIQRLLKRVEDFYVLQSQAQEIMDNIRERHASHAYQELEDPQQFARQLTLDLREASQDAHFGIMYNSETFQAMASELPLLDGPNSRETMKEWLEDDDAAPDIGSLAGDKRQNFFFTRLEILEGNVGYLRLDRIPALDPAKPTVDAAMAFLAHSDAVILDLRGNPGGVGGFITYLMSYFFPEGRTYLYKRDFQAVGVVDEFYTEETLPGKRLDHVPLYVLIDPFTGSAARNLSYTLQTFERAILVGEATGEQGYRGAHSAGLFPLADGLLAVVPIGRVVNAKTNTNWREGGVQPDVSVSSKEALDAAHQLALETLLERTGDAAITQELNQALQNLDSKQEAAISPPVDEAAMAEYVGVYGVRTISLDDGVLKYTREGMGVKLEMQEIEKDLYTLVIPSNTRSASVPNVRFNRDEQGSVVGLSLISPDGSVMETTNKDE